ncbi:hypothetical protein OUHCRE2_20490 [Enterobacter asburiae]|nr:hypothetical protein TUM17556_20440 [Enterobacter asburiae]
MRDARFMLRFLIHWQDARKLKNQRGGNHLAKQNECCSVSLAKDCSFGANRANHRFQSLGA